MTGGMRGGFFAGAVGGLALALLLVGLVSFLPQSNTALQMGFTTGKNAVSGASVSSTRASGATSTSISCSTWPDNPPPWVRTTCDHDISSSTTQSSTISSAINAPVQVSGAAAVSTATTTVTTTATATSTESAAGIASAPSPTATSTVAQQEAKPNSLLSVLPGESVAGLIATLSPLIIGLVVAALIYGAYSRRQDSSA